MSKDSKILLTGLGTAVLLPLLVGGLLGWPQWVTVPLFIAVITGTYRKLVHGIPTPSDRIGALLDKLGPHTGNPDRDLTASPKSSTQTETPTSQMKSEAPSTH